tara:strand:+ start:9541 stop:9939 length:399 start_codon:yes stop_codon:yes gene_type:complete
MKKTELKEIIKPLVKECIQEVLIEEGLLSNVVSEVVKGLGTQSIVEQAPVPRPAPQPKINNNALKEQRAALMNAINKDAYNGVDLFEGTDAMSSYEATPQPAGAVDLGNPSDPGVDISSLMGASSQIWNRIK